MNQKLLSTASSGFFSEPVAHSTPRDQNGVKFGPFQKKTLSKKLKEVDLFNTNTHRTRQQKNSQGQVKLKYPVSAMEDLWEQSNETKKSFASAEQPKNQFK